MNHPYYDCEKREITLFWLVKIIVEQHLEEPGLAQPIQFNIFSPFELDAWLRIPFCGAKPTKISVYDSLDKILKDGFGDLHGIREWTLTIVHELCPVICAMPSGALPPIFSMYLNKNDEHKHSFGLFATDYEKPFHYIVTQCRVGKGRLLQLHIG